MESKPIYKTAEELGIKQWERDGLAALVGPLSRGELEFDMRSDCGTVACIGGWNAALGERDVRDHVRFSCSPALWSLYYPGGAEWRAWWTRRPLLTCTEEGYSHEAWKASAPQAARAVVNFLTLGDPRWDDVMASAA